jgi:hypothetical protein
MRTEVLGSNFGTNRSSPSTPLARSRPYRPRTKRMMTTSSRSDVVQECRNFCGSGDDGLRTAVLDLLHSSGYAALRRLQCEVTEAVVIVHGILPSYFLKQMAQTIIQRIDGIQSVTNLVEVRQDDRVPARCLE